MNFILVLFLTFSISYADHVTKKSLACPSVLLIKKAPRSGGKSGMDITFYSIANNCKIISPRDHLVAVGYDPRNSKEIFQQVIYSKTGDELYILKNNLIVEQVGKYNRMRF